MPADLIFQLGWDTSRCHSLTCFIWPCCHGYLYFAVALSSALFVFSCDLELRAIFISLCPSSVVVFVFRCGLELRAICLLMWLGLPSYLYFALAWSSELSSSIVLRCGLELRAICLLMWLGLPSYLYFAVACMFHFAMGWNCSANVLSCWCSTGRLFLCLMSCWWLDSIFFIFVPVGARRDFCFFV